MASSPRVAAASRPRLGCASGLVGPRSGRLGRYPPITTERYCEFCRIIAGQAPADILHDSERVMVFRNVLNWVPVMLLAVPKEHMPQREFWEGEWLAEVGRVASEVGREHCPNGYRLVSNLGWEAKQSQEHAHIHVLGGTFLGDYVNPGGLW